MQPQNTAVAGICAAAAVHDVQANSTPADEGVPGMQSAKCSTCSISRGRHPVHPPGRRPGLRRLPCPPRDPKSCPCHARGHHPLAASLQFQPANDIKMLAHIHRSLSLSSHASAGSCWCSPSRLNFSSFTLSMTCMVRPTALRRATGFHARVCAIADILVAHLIRYPQVLDGVATDISLGHPPESVAILQNRAHGICKGCASDRPLRDYGGRSHAVTSPLMCISLPAGAHSSSCRTPPCARCTSRHSSAPAAAATMQSINACTMTPVRKRQSDWHITVAQCWVALCLCTNGAVPYHGMALRCFEQQQREHDVGC